MKEPFSEPIYFEPQTIYEVLRQEQETLEDQLKAQVRTMSILDVCDYQIGKQNELLAEQNKLLYRLLEAQTELIESIESLKKEREETNNGK